VIGFWSLFSFLFGSLLGLIPIVVARIGDRVGESSLLALNIIPVLFILAGFVLGWIWLRRLQGTPVALSGRAFALTFLSVFVPVALSIVTISTSMISMREIAQARAAKIEAHHAKLALLQEGLETADEALERARNPGAAETRIPPSDPGHDPLEQLQLTDISPDPQFLMFQSMAGEHYSVRRMPAPGDRGEQKWPSIPFGIAGCALGWRHLSGIRVGGSPRVGVFHEALVPITVGLLLAVTGFFFISRGKKQQAGGDKLAGDE
jgi:hypothetical protein